MAADITYTSVDNEVSDILNTCFVTSFRNGYVKANDVVLPVYFKKFGQRIQDMQVRDDDIWVCSYPKTGKVRIRTYDICTTLRILYVVIRVKIEEVKLAECARKYSRKKCVLKICILWLIIIVLNSYKLELEFTERGSRNDGNPALAHNLLASGDYGRKRRRDITTRRHV